MDSAKNPTTLTSEAYISTKKGENRKRASRFFLKWLQLSIRVKKVGGQFLTGPLKSPLLQKVVLNAESKLKFFYFVGGQGWAT